MTPFVYTAPAARVVFGSGTRATLADEIRMLSCRRALILSTPPQRGAADQLAADIGELAAGVLSEATMHTPIDVTERAVARARALAADCVVAIGGGSSVGLGKAIALNTDLPQIVLPTTYAGSEATSILGQTADGEKRTLRSPKVQPEVIIYDVDLTLTLSTHQTAVSGMNAIAHAVEALYAQDGNPVTSVLAEEAIRRFASSLPKLVASPSDFEARSDALYAAWLCGTCLNAVSMGLHHKLCHTLGGLFDLPHAETHTMILPHAAAYNAAAAPEALRRAAGALGTEDAAAGLFDLATRLGAPTSLSSLGLKRDDLDRAARAAVQTPYPNPRPLALPAIRELLDNAFEGVRPGSDAGRETLDA
ncbi:maleylacetate reductase [Afipia sp. GAS231]|uniref:maleylacetate reductase n=1 Tax=Afipia sp. GAS231 TaxID=1882747 RepID=UPI00087B1E81|nr:maleylacetate reductase [Afipia sp. GAS231]SDN73435.1 Alcohol dehydrogenase, class IV [Afipia sp. GAS231]